MFCINCGKKIEEQRMKFCPYCGTLVEDIHTQKESLQPNISALNASINTSASASSSNNSNFTEGNYFVYRFGNASATIYLQEMLQGTRKVKATILKGSMARQLHKEHGPTDYRFSKSKAMGDYYLTQVASGSITEQSGTGMAVVQTDILFEGSLSALATMLSGDSIAPNKAWKLTTKPVGHQARVSQNVVQNTSLQSKINTAEVKMVAEQSMPKVEETQICLTEEKVLDDLLEWMDTWLEGLVNGDREKELQRYEKYVKINFSIKEYIQLLEETDNSKLGLNFIFEKYCEAETAKILKEKIGGLRKYWLSASPELFEWRMCKGSYISTSINHKVFPKNSPEYEECNNISLYDLPVYIKAFQEIAKHGFKKADDLYKKWKPYDYVYGDGRSLEGNSPVILSMPKDKVPEKKHSYYWNLSNQYIFHDSGAYWKYSYNDWHFYVQEYKGDIYYMKAIYKSLYGTYEPEGIMIMYKQNIKTGQNIEVFRFNIKATDPYTQRGSDEFNALCYRLFTIRDDIIYYVNDQKLNRASLDGTYLGIVEEISDKVIEAPIVLDAGYVFLSARGSALMFCDSRSGNTIKIGTCKEIIAVNETEVYYTETKNGKIKVFNPVVGKAQKITDVYNGIKKKEDNIIYVDAGTDIVYYIEPDDKDEHQSLTEEQRTLIGSRIIGVDRSGNEVDCWKAPKMKAMHHQLYKSEYGYASFSFNGEYLTCKFSKGYNRYDLENEINTWENTCKMKKNLDNYDINYAFLSFTRSGDVHFMITKNDSYNAFASFLYMTEHAAMIYIRSDNNGSRNYYMASTPLLEDELLQRNGELKKMKNGDDEKKGRI